MAMINALQRYISSTWTSALEILIIAVVLYFIYINLRRTQGARIFIGLALVFFALLLLSQTLHLGVILSLLRSLSFFLAVALVVIFQPELRRAFTDLGSHPFFKSDFEKRETIEDMLEAVFDLSGKGFGALLAIEREISLKSFIDTGIALDAQFSKELTLTVFHPKTVLHDGGMILRGERVVAAACIFPLTQREDLDRNLGLRHRAALGLAEESDAVIIVVSEENGQISICHGARLERNLKPEQFRAVLTRLLTNEPDSQSPAQELEAQAGLSALGGSPVVSDPAESLRDGPRS